MAYTPKKYLAVLDMLAEPTPNVAVPQGLGVAGVRHLSQVRSIFQDPNVVGAGVSEKQTDGQRIGQLSLSFYAKKKLPRDEVDRGNMLPPVVASPTGGAVFTDVIELGTVVPQARLPLVHRNPISKRLQCWPFHWWRRDRWCDRVAGQQEVCAVQFTCPG